MAGSMASGTHLSPSERSDSDRRPYLSVSQFLPSKWGDDDSTHSKGHDECEDSGVCSVAVAMAVASRPAPSAPCQGKPGRQNGGFDEVEFGGEPTPHRKRNLKSFPVSLPALSWRLVCASGERSGVLCGSGPLCSRHRKLNPAPNP